MIFRALYLTVYEFRRALFFHYFLCVYSLNGQLAKGMVPDDVIRGCVPVASIVTRADLLLVASPSSSEAERDMAILCAMGDPPFTSSHCTHLAYTVHTLCMYVHV